VDATVNIHDPLTALLCFGTTPKIDSSNYRTQSTASSCLNSRVRKCVTLVVSTKGILAACSTKYEKIPGLDIVSYISLQQSLHKIRWSSGFLTSGRIKTRPDKWTRDPSGQSMPVARLGHQVGRRVFWEGSKFFKLCPTYFHRRGENNLGGSSSWLRTWDKVVTARPPKSLAQVRSSLLCLQRQVEKIASGLLYSWSL